MKSLSAQFGKANDSGLMSWVGISGIRVGAVVETTRMTQWTSMKKLQMNTSLSLIPILRYQVSLVMNYAIAVVSQDKYMDARQNIWPTVDTTDKVKQLPTILLRLRGFWDSYSR